MAQDKKDGKLFIFGKDAREAILVGSQTVYDAVTLTYGPKGKNVILEKTYGRPVVTRDGVTVARESYLEERGPNQGAQLLIEASQTTNRIAGDGTTATVALTHNLIKLGLDKIAAGVNPMDVKKEIKDDARVVLKELDSMSQPVAKGQLQQVASVSCGDEALGKLIAEAVETVGADGGIIAEKALITGVDRTYVNGYFLQQGFSAIEQGKKEISNPYVVISSKPINSAADIITLINKIGVQAHLDQGLPLSEGLQQPLQIAFFGEFEADAYNILVANIQKGAFDGTITKTPPMGEMGVQFLEDLAIYSGGKVIKAGDKLADVDGSFFGKAEKVACTATETTVFGGQHADEDLEKRIKEIKDRMKAETNDALLEKLRDRLAKLENKIALFRIGGATETEREELEFRIEDAVQATRAAASDGVVTGGGMTLVELSKLEVLGIFSEALQAVFKKLIENAGLSGEVKLNEALEAPEGLGFNLRENGELVDLIDAGILDPTLVIQQVITNAAATAADAVSLGAIITFQDKDDLPTNSS